MQASVYFIGFQTIVKREITKFLRTWIQSLLPPLITSVLYFIIFGHLIGNRIGGMHGVSYIKYIAPGLIMMAVITNAYSNVVGSIFMAKFQRNIEELLISPLPNYIILLGYVSGGVVRAIIVGVIVTLSALFFTQLHIQHPFLLIAVVIIAAALLSIIAFINGIYAKNFDHISIVPTFILTPLTYLGGVFYSINLLPHFWRQLSYGNPILYMINIFRYSMLGISDINIWTSLSFLVVLTVFLFYLALYLLNKGSSIKA